MPQPKIRPSRSERALAGSFLRSFLQNPKQVASIIPSSRFVVKKVASKMDLTKPRVIAEFGPGEGVVTREILRRSPAGTRMILFELNEVLYKLLRDEFADDERVEVLHEDARNIVRIAEERGITGFDYIFSGIPFSLMDPKPKQELMYQIYEGLVPGGSFIIYQVTNELKRYGQHFDKIKSEWAPMNIPPYFITVYHKSQENGAK